MSRVRAINAMAEDQNVIFNHLGLDDRIRDKRVGLGLGEAAQPEVPKGVRFSDHEVRPVRLERAERL